VGNGRKQSFGEALLTDPRKFIAHTIIPKHGDDGILSTGGKRLSLSPTVCSIVQLICANILKNIRRNALETLKAFGEQSPVLSAIFNN
jgi:hypothetical protein